MRKQLGTRCPECGTGDAPTLQYEDRVTHVTCTRCGHWIVTPHAHSPERTLAVFYGNQRVEAPPITHFATTNKASVSAGLVDKRDEQCLLVINGVAALLGYESACALAAHFTRAAAYLEQEVGS